MLKKMYMFLLFTVLTFIQVKRVYKVKAGLHAYFVRMAMLTLNCKIWDIYLSVVNMRHFVKLFAYLH